MSAPCLRGRPSPGGAAKGKGLDRVTLTAPVINSARKILFLVSGSGKQEALRRLLDPAEPIQRTPARLVKSSESILILADKDAAGGLPKDL